MVGMVARLTWEKGFSEFLQAASQILNVGKDVLFVIVGPDDAITQTDLQQRCDQLGLDSTVKFLGRRTDLPRIYAVMDAVVLPSYREGLEQVLVEASAMDKPLIAKDIRGCREAVVDRVTGFLVPPKDADTLAQAVLCLMHSPGSARRMGVAGRKRVHRLFNQNRTIREIIEQYKHLIEERDLARIQSQILYRPALERPGTIG